MNTGTKWLLGLGAAGAAWLFWPKAAAAAGGSSATPQEATNALQPTGDESTKLYTLKPGDTLSGLAKAFYGDFRWWPTLLDANRAAIPDPDQVSSGLTIKVPVAAPMNQQTRIFARAAAHASWWKSGRAGPIPPMVLEG